MVETQLLSQFISHLGGISGLHQLLFQPLLVLRAELFALRILQAAQTFSLLQILHL